MSRSLTTRPLRAIVGRPVSGACLPAGLGYAAAMRALVASWLVVLTSCGLSTPIEAQHPSVQRVPGSIDGSTEERHAALVATAKGDLACVNVDVVLTLDRRYANSVVVRHVVEGCGKRALYVETCEAYPSCRYLVVSVLPLASVGAVTSPASAPPPATPSAPSPPPAPAATPAPSGSAGVAL